MLVGAYSRDGLLFERGAYSIVLCYEWALVRGGAWFLALQRLQIFIGKIEQSSSFVDICNCGTSILSFKSFQIAARRRNLYESHR